ncbi:MAG: hypothetical protein ACYC3G_00370 [Minisyncoccota bacterium]
MSDNFTKDTLLKIAEVGLFVVAATSSPYFLHRLARNYFKDKTKDEIRKRSKKLCEFNKRKLIDFKELGDGSVSIVISQAGKNIIQQYKLDDMRIVKPKIWDRQWRIVIYDIPQKFRKSSDAFRRKIRELGMFQLQKSIWVYPYECIKELDFLCAMYGIPLDDCILYFKTKELPKEKEIRDFFNV